MPTRPEGLRPAGFWQRYAAWSLDAALLAIPTWLLAHGAIASSLPAWRRFGDALTSLFGNALQAAVAGASPLQAGLGMLSDPALRTASGLLHAALWSTLALPVAVFVALAFAWHLGFERSRWHASPGKRALRLRVTDAAGGVPPLANALARFWAGGLGWLTLNLGHAMAALPPAHLALHDRLSGTRVLAVADGRALPAWARAWLWLQLAAFVAANAWLLMRVEAALQAALDAALY